MSDTIETAHPMIASDRVEGTAVFNRAGERLGRVERFMVDKVSGHAQYAVMSFGGLFGIGHRHYPTAPIRSRSIPITASPTSSRPWANASGRSPSSGAAA